MSAFAFSKTADDFITNQVDQFAHASQSRFAKYFHELSIKKQENYRINVKEYKRKKKTNRQNNSKNA